MKESLEHDKVPRMDRRNFLGMMVGGVAASAAVRTWPFRVFSFPSAPTLSRVDFLDLDQWMTGYFPGFYGEPQSATAIAAIINSYTDGERRLRSAATRKLLQSASFWNGLELDFVSKSRQFLDG